MDQGEDEVVVADAAASDNADDAPAPPDLGGDDGQAMDTTE